MPLGQIIDYFYRVEFQQRGSPHIHALFWVKDAPKYGKDSDETITDFVDKYVTCAERIPLENSDDLINLQTHRHSKTCKKRNKNVCRFNFPLPPMRKTTILRPLDNDCLQPCEINTIKRNCENVQILLSEMKYGDDITFDDFLKVLDMEESAYIQAIRYSIKKATLFLKRSPKEIRINSYNQNLLAAWQANMDLQYVLDPYACAVYILSYISKGQRGMSKLLEQANNDAHKLCGENIQNQVRHIGNKFMNAVEISAQEAVYLVMQMPLRRSSRTVQFINTAPTDERCFLLKSMDKINELPDNSTEIESDNIIKRYQRRPRQLENICLADFVAWYEISTGDAQFKNTRPERNQKASNDILENDLSENHDDDCIIEDDLEVMGKTYVLLGGLRLVKRTKSKVIRSVRYDRKKDPENHFRERLMLYMPWRNEHKDLLCGSKSYEENYEKMQAVIDRNSQNYEKYSAVFQQVAEDLLFDDLKEYSTVAPNAQHNDDQDKETGSLASKFFGCFDPTSCCQSQYDLLDDIGIYPRSQGSTIVETPSTTDLQFREKVQLLNKEQMEFFYHVLHSVKGNKEPLRLFLSGGAGVGKSFVLNVLYEAITRYLNKLPGENPDDVKVIKVAPTGKAAFNIGGNTIHSAFNIPASQGFKYTALDSDRLNTMRKQYKSLKIIFIDEISMVGSGLFSFLNQRLQQIMGTHSPFGDLTVIAVGDLFQLQPVFDKWIFERPCSDYSALATNIWEEYFKCCELKTILRQKEDKKFAQLLNRLREGNQSERDIETLKTRVLSANSNSMLAYTHLFLTNASVDAFNSSIFQNAKENKAVVKAIDIVVGDLKDDVKEKLLTRIPNDPTKTMGLHSALPIVVGGKYDLTSNIKTTDGLTNGAECTVAKIDYRVANSMRPSIIWVKFTEESIGQTQRLEFRALRTKEIDTSWTPIFEVKKQFVIGRSTHFKFMRRQFPLRQAAAKTIHRCQGDTMQNLVVSFAGRPRDHIHYVGLSRVVNMDGLLIENLNESKISVCEKVREEMNRLRLRSKYIPSVQSLYSISASLKVIFHNVRSLPLHKYDVFHDFNVSSSDINIFVETNLTSKHRDEDFAMTGFQLHRNDNTEDLCSKAVYGTVVYTKQHITYRTEPLGQTCDNIEITVAILDEPIPNLHLISVYRSPKVSMITLLNVMQLIHNHILQGKPAIIMGDFNVNLLEDSSQRSALLSEMNNIGYTQLIKEVTTDYGSMLDHIYTNTQNFVSHVGVLESYFSDHKPIFLCLK